MQGYLKMYKTHKWYYSRKADVWPIKEPVGGGFTDVGLLVKHSDPKTVLYLSKSYDWYPVFRVYE